MAMQRAERWGLVMARPLEVMSKLARPIVWFLSRSTDIAVRLMGCDPNLQREEVTEEEIRDLVAVQPTFTDEQRQIIDGAFEISERRLDEVLVPRSAVFVLDPNLSGKEGLLQLAASGHSRAPVAESDNLDLVIGWVHLRDLLDAGDVPVANVVVELLAFPGSAKALPTLRELQCRRTQIALVVDEHGGVQGIVTIEDLVEELVGEIYDETDPDLASVVHESDGTILLPGRFPIHELVDIGVELPAGDFKTIAGLALQQFGRIPTIGDVVTVGEWKIEVRGTGRHSITQLGLIGVTPPTPEGDTGEDLGNGDKVVTDVGGVLD